MKIIKLAVLFMLIFTLFHQVSYAGSSVNNLLGEQPLLTDGIFQFQTGDSQSDFQSPPPSKSKFQLDVGFLHKVLGWEASICGVSKILQSSTMAAPLHALQMKGSHSCKIQVPIKNR